jgi:choice-of-anchor B domain-containing protein
MSSRSLLHRLAAIIAFAAAAAPGAAQTARPAAPAMIGFGTALAIDGGDILVSRTGMSSFIPLKADRAGAVHVFRHGDDGWREVALITASESEVGDEFGSAMALGGGTLAVVSPEVDDGAGAVYLFTKDGETWRQEARVVATPPGDSVPAEAFGATVAVHGDWLFVGAPRQDRAAGAVYVFRRGDDGTWQQEAILAADDGAARDRFGEALAFNGTDLVVAAPRAERRRGRVYVLRYDESASAWQEVARFESPFERPLRFGTRLALSADYLAVGPGSRANQNGIAMFVRDGDVWSDAGSAMPDSSAGQSFGRALAISSNELWVGEPGHYGQRGQMHHFVRDRDGAWDHHDPMAPADLGPNTAFGATLSATFDLLVVGALGTDLAMGAGHVYRRTGDGWIPDGVLADQFDDMTAMVGEEVRCEEGMAGPFECTDVELLSFVPPSDLGAERGVFVNDLWGWTDPETGREYAIVGRVDATVFLDITDPTNPVWVGELAMHEGSRANFWRDIKVYNDHAFIVADGAGPHGMQVFDLRQLRDVTDAPATFAETAHYDGIASSHNIVINEETGYAFAVGASGGGETCGGALHMINIQDPANPTFAGCYADTNAGMRGTGYTHDAQCVVYHGPDAEHQGKEVCFGSSENALTIADVSDKNAPLALSTGRYPNAVYAHQGWLTDDHRYFYMNDEGDELSGELPGTRTLIWDVSDLDDPVMVREHFGVTRASDHNLYVRGDLMYQSNYVSGLRVLDITDPEHPVEVAFFDTVPYGDNEPGFGGSWSNYPYFESGTIVVTSSREGVFLLKKRPTEMTP